VRFFLQTISIIRYKILRLEVEKHHFIFIIGPYVISIVRYKILWLEVEKHHFILIIGPHVNT
jgi:hypothetical protein